MVDRRLTRRELEAIICDLNDADEVVYAAADKINRLGLLEEVDYEDRCKHVRAEIACISAKMGRDDVLDKLAYALDTLADDPSFAVRAMVAREARFASRADLLEKLAGDKDKHVRWEVVNAAACGCYMDLLKKLAKDRNRMVKSTARRWIKNLQANRGRA